MKSPKNIRVVVKELTIRMKKEIIIRSVHVIATVVFLSVASLAAVRIMYLNQRHQRFILSNEYTSSMVSPSLLSSCPFHQNFDNVPLPSRQNYNDTVTDDEELMWRASMVPRDVDYQHNKSPKVAFMFLTRRRLPLAPLWELFFKGHKGFYSIYVHTAPEFSDEPPESSVFYKRRIQSKAVEWGRSTMIDAERRLLSHALLDISNARFVLLSETCIPLFNFTTIYNYLTRSTRSFLGSFDDPRPVGRGRYTPKMLPLVSLSDWRKGNQWFELCRRVAFEVVSDRQYYSVLKEHCRPPCYMDEHYLPTLVNKVCPEMNSNRSITWVDWSKGGSHPATFVRKDITLGFLDRIRFGSNCSNERGSTTPCFLFARKFHVSTLEPLMRIASTLYGL